MTIFSSIYVGFGVVQLFSALSFGLLSRRSALAKAQTNFGWVAVLLGSMSFLQAAELRASSVHEAAIWQSLVFASHYGTLVAFAPFARRYFDLEERSYGIRLALALVVIASLPILAGLAFDPGDLLTKGSPLLPGPERPVARMTGVGIACALIGFVGYGIAWGPGLRSLVRARGGRGIVLLLSLTSAGYALDFAHHLSGVRALPLAPFSALAFSLVLSLLILENYLEVREALERHAAELRLRYDQIAFIETEIGKKEPLAIVGELSAVIARQIQTPVATLREASADLRIESLAPEQRAHALDILDGETSRLNRLISDLLTYARPVEPQLEPIDLTDVWNEAMASFQRDGGRRLRSRLDIAPGVTRLDGDPRLLVHAATLLLENASGFLEDGEEISIRGRRVVESGTDLLRVEIRDTGTWIESIARSTLGTKRRDGEHGMIDALELGIIDKVVSAHGGRFYFEKRADGEVIGVIILPLSVA